MLVPSAIGMFEIALQGTEPGEVDVATNDSSWAAFVANEFHLGNSISMVPSTGMECTVYIPTVKTE